MTKKVAKPPKKDDFASVAKRLGCDESKSAFEKKLGKIAKGSVKSARGATGKQV